MKLKDNLIKYNNLSNIAKALMMLLCILASLLCLSTKVQASKAFGELYKLEDGYITRILPQTTVEDLQNNLETDEKIVVTNKDGKTLKEDEFVGTGMTLKIKENSYKLSVIGDLDGNGKLTITDLIKMKLYQSNLEDIPEYNEKSIDINGSGAYTITDVTQLNLAIIEIKDLIAPNNFVPTATTTLDTITLTGKTVDENSGIAEYFFKIDDEEWVQNKDKTSGTYIFKNLEKNKTYTLKMKVKDKAGNTRVTEAIEADLIDGALDIIPSITRWTNKDITIYVEENSNTADTKVLVSIDGGKNFEEYRTPIKLTKNAGVIAKLVSNDNEILAEKKIGIINIDKLEPDAFEINTKVETNKITINAETTDAEATSENGQSQIKQYEYTIRSGLWRWKETTTETVHEFKTLIQGQTYNITVTAIDNAGNRRISEKTVTTKTIDELGQITLIPNTTEWTKEDVTVEGRYPDVEGYIKQISIDDGVTWQNYTGPIVISRNNTIVKARILDEEGQTGRITTLLVANIDKEIPNEFVASTKSSPYSITVEGSTTDNLSGIKGYYYSKDNGVTWQEENVFQGLNPDTMYSIKMKAVDNVGNEYITEVNETKTKPVYTLTIDPNEGEYSGKTTVIQGANTTTTVVAPTRVGYTFKGWTKIGEGNLNEYVFTFGNGDATLTAKWEANTDTKYVVNHYQMGINGAYSTIATETEEKKGISDSSLTLADFKKTYTGFKYVEGKVEGNVVTTTTVTPNGSRVINLYYERNKYTFTLGSGTGATTTGSTASGSYYYGYTINLKATANAGYTWGKWTSSNTSLIASTTTANTTFAMPAGNIKMTPSASTITYTISYNLDGGAVQATNPTSYTVTTNTITLNNPSKTGYTFAGWTGSNGTTPQTTVTIVKGSTGDKTYTAKWTADEVTVTYQYNGATSGNTVASKKVTYGNTYGSLPSPTKSYTVSFNTNGGNTISDKTATYTFNGWYKESTFTNRVTSTTNVIATSNHYLYAKWTSASVSLPIPTKSGYTFVGWYTNSGLTSAVSGTTYTPTANTTLYAKWEVDEVTVTYQYNGATSGNTSTSKTVTYGNTYGTLPSPTRSYTVSFNTNGGNTISDKTATYTFNGWYKESTFANKVISTTTVTTASNHYLYAKWTSGSVSLPTPTKDGYGFAGWYTNSSLTNAVSGTTYTPTANTTLYAKWEADQITVTYQYNGATGGNTTTSKSVIYGNTYGSLPSPTRSYTVSFNTNGGNTISDKTATYTFNGWYKENSFANKVISTTTVTTANSHYLYAKWTSASVSLPTPTKEGYTFGGWYTNSGLTSAVSGISYTPEANITLYAKWTADQYTVSYEYNGATGGNTSASKSVTYGSTYGTLANPTRKYTVSFNTNGGNSVSSQTASYTFNGWYKESSFTNKVTSGTTVTTAANHTLYASWTSSGITLPTPTKSGYEFVGWYADSDLNSLVGIAGDLYTPTEAATLYAKWEAAVYATLYTDGTLGFNSTSAKISSKTVEKDFGNIIDDTGTPYWYSYASDITNVYFVNKVCPKSTERWFLDCVNLTKITNMSNLDTSQVTNMSEMFEDCQLLITIDVSGFDTSNVTDMSDMFTACFAVTSLDVSGFDTSNVTDMSNMFYACHSLTTIDARGLETENVTNMSGMFQACLSVKTIYVSGFDTRNVTDMSYMFARNEVLQSLDLRDFNTRNVTDMSYMFWDCYEISEIKVGSNWVTASYTLDMFTQAGVSSVTRY